MAVFECANLTFNTVRKVTDMMKANQGPPYAPQTWALGGAPVKQVDIPVQTIFMFLFMVSAAVHMKIFQKNRARGFKFLPNLFIFSKFTFWSA